MNIWTILLEIKILQIMAIQSKLWYNNGENERKLKGTPYDSSIFIQYNKDIL